MRRLDTPARKSEDLPASMRINALRGTGVSCSKPLFSSTPSRKRPRVSVLIRSFRVREARTSIPVVRPARPADRLRVDGRSDLQRGGECPLRGSSGSLRAETVLLAVA